MTNYIIRRILLLIPILFIVSVIVFLLVRWVPGSAIDVITATMGQSGITQVDRAAIAHDLGLDVPIHIQYVRWIGGIILRGDFGNSIIQGRPVLGMIFERLPVTLELGLLSLVISTVIGLLIGTISAVRQDSMADYSGRTIAILLMAIASFWLAILVIIYPSIWWG